MSRYIKKQAETSHRYLAWISMFLLIFNALQGKLSTMIFRSSAVIAAVQAAAVVLLLVYLVMDKKQKLLYIQLQAMDLILISTFAVMLFTTEDFAENMTYLIRYGILILVVIVMKYDENLPEIAIKCVLIVSSIHVICTIWFYFDQPFYLNNIYPTFDTQQKSHLYAQVVRNGYATGLASHYSANGMNIAIALCTIYAFLYNKMRKLKRVFLVLGLIIFLATLFSTGKRGVLIFALAALLFTYIVCNRDLLENKLIKLILIVAATGTLIYILSFYVESIGVTIERMFETLGMGKNSTLDVSNGRFKLYSIALSLFAENPIFGIGWRQFTNDVSIYYGDDSALRDAHNVFLQLLCETGIVGFLVFTTLFVSAFALTIYIIVRSGREGVVLPQKCSMFMAFSLCYQTFFLLYCMTGNPLYDLQTVYVYILSIGISACIYHNYKDALAVEPVTNVIKSRYLV